MNLVEEVRSRFHFSEPPRRIDRCVGEESQALVFRQTRQRLRTVTTRTHQFIDQRALQLAERRFNRTGLRFVAHVDSARKCCANVHTAVCLAD